MEKYSDDKFIELAKKLDELIRGKSNLKSNLIDEFHLYENQHSRILRMFLEYYDGERYPIFESFVELLAMNINSENSFKIKIKKPNFTNEKERIDLLVQESNSYGIIIENKINWACDQDEQIKRYLKRMCDKGIPKNRLYAIYLTSDGNKKVTETSLTEDAKKMLEYKLESDHGRFFEVNFRNDIIPWLEKKVLPNIKIKEDLLAASIKIYIDYLKGLYDLKIDKKHIENKLIDMMKLDNKDINELSEIESQIWKLYVEVRNIRSKKISKELDEKLIKPLNDHILEKYQGNLTLKTEQNKNFYYQIDIENKNWEHSIIRIANNEYPYKSFVGITCKSGYSFSDKDLSKVNEKLPNYSNNEWWPCWQYITYSKPKGLDQNRGNIDLTVLKDPIIKIVDEIMAAVSDLKL